MYRVHYDQRVTNERISDRRVSERPFRAVLDDGTGAIAADLSNMCVERIFGEGFRVLGLGRKLNLIVLTHPRLESLFWFHLVKMLKYTN